MTPHAGSTPRLGINPKQAPTDFYDQQRFG
jgi:hypothetical protein